MGVHISQYTIQTIAYSIISNKREKTKEKILTFIVQNLVLKILFTHRFCLSFSNHVCQTNKLKTAQTLQCTLYTVHYVTYRLEFSTLKTSQERGHFGRNANVTNKQAVLDF